MEHYREDIPYCHIHPTEATRGVCPLCLKEGLLILESKFKQELLVEIPHRRQNALVKVFSFGSLAKTSHTHYRAPSKVFSFKSLLHSFRFQQQKLGDTNQDTPSSPEDSIFSIDIGNNICTLRNTGLSSRPPQEALNFSSSQNFSKEATMAKTVVKHKKLHCTMRWRKRIRQFLQHPWRRS